MAGAQLGSTDIHSMIYELRTYATQPANFREFVGIAEEVHCIQMKSSPLLGCWTAEVGGLNQLLHIWPFESYAHLGAVRAGLGADAQFIETAKKGIHFMQTMNNCMLRLFPWSPLTTSVAPGGAYVMYKLTFNQDRDMSADLRTFVDSLHDVNIIGAWYEAVGSSCLLNAYTIIQCKSLDSEHCPINFSSDQMSELKRATSQVQSMILAPTRYSPLQ